MEPSHDVRVQCKTHGEPSSPPAVTNDDGRNDVFAEDKPTVIEDVTEKVSIALQL